MSLENFPKFLLNFSENEMQEKNCHAYRFKAFRLNVEERQLLNHDHPVPLTPKAFDVLVALVERSGHLVEKDELMRIVWSDSFVEEANVARLVHTLRKALGDDGNGNKFIETIAKKGYRFVAEVRDVSKSAAPQTNNGHGHYSKSLEKLSALNTAELLPAERLVQIPRVLFFIAGFVSAILMLFFFLVEIEVRPTASLPKDKTKSIAVLPLKPLKPTKRDELYEIGVADSLINRLSRMKGFVIRPLSATRQYAEGGTDPLAAGKDQQVDYVLASSYQLANGKFHITTELFNVATGQVEETYKGEKDDTDIFAIQESVAAEVGTLLQTRFATASVDTSAKRETADEEAYRLSVQGKNLNANGSAADSRKAVVFGLK